MSDIKIAFWKLENLFDTKVSEIAANFEFTAVPITAVNSKFTA